MMRSVLISNIIPKTLINSHLYGEDYLIFNFGANTPLEELDADKELLIQALKQMDYELEKIIIHINNFDKNDIEEIFQAGVSNFSFHINSKEEVVKIDSFLNDLEKRGKSKEKIKIMLFIGNPALVLNVQDIIIDRVFAIVFDKKEFRKYLKVPEHKSNEDLILPKKMFVLGSLAKKIYCIDGGFEDFSDEDNFIKEIKESMNIGFNGKICLHPLQVGIVNNIYRTNPYYREL